MPSEAHANCRFYVEIDSIPHAVFTEVSGLQMEMETMDYAEGGNNSFVHRLPGRIKVGNLTLKRGMTSSNEFLNWYSQAMQGQIVRRNLSVVMYNSLGKELMRWNFLNAYPVKWTGPQFAASGNTLAVETMELAHEGVRVG